MFGRVLNKPPLPYTMQCLENSYKDLLERGLRNAS